MLVNILENAVQHATDMKKLALRVSKDNKKAIFEVFDDGCGIDKEALPRIFEGYFALGAELSDVGKRNAGIGLSVCSTIIKAHGSKITAENLPDGGALFRFALDISEDIDCGQQE